MGVEIFDTIFHDGRIELDPAMPSGIAGSAGKHLPDNLDNALAAQAMFPVTSGLEMAGQPGENSIADEAAAGNLAGDDGVWAQLAERLQAIDIYVDLFIEAFGDVNNADDITFAHAANAIAAFEASSRTANGSRFDRFLKGDPLALSTRERRGLRLFYGKANCVSCHSGPLLTDLDFHAIAMPRLGPVKGLGMEGREDFGRELVSGNPTDRYKFSTPTLRNVALRAPYGRLGAYDTLEGVVRHHLDPVRSLKNYDRANFVAPYRSDLESIDFFVMDSPKLVQEIAKANESRPNQRLKDHEIRDLIAFLHTLTDTSSIDLRSDVPSAVPSGLPIYE